MRSVEGRIFEHAADSRILLEHLINLKIKNQTSSKPNILFYISTKKDDCLIQISRKHIDLTL